MSATDLLKDLSLLGVRVEVVGDRLRYSPRSAMTPDLLARLDAQKAELLTMLRPAPDARHINRNDAAAVWQAAIDRLEDNPSFPLDVIQTLRAAQVRWANDEPNGEKPAPDAFGPDGWPRDSIDPDEIDPCPTCGTLELWQTMAGNWRCMKCDPPTKSLQILELVARLRGRDERRRHAESRRFRAGRPAGACQCGSTRWIDVPIHNGQSVRRDCRRCGQTIEFPVWYGQPLSGDPDSSQVR
ncbi:MAG: hypothetical protein DWQ37_06130 [Planctomycetota bacterium]|nr:MAG: hypothetical protein DWQ37_06130 [Planctomycetota bacterium]